MRTKIFLKTRYYLFFIGALFGGVLLGFGLGPFMGETQEKVLLLPARAQFPVEEFGSGAYLGNRISPSFQAVLDKMKRREELLGVKLGSNKNGRVVIALFGDSMTDTMGTNAPYLEVALKQYYPNIDFQIYNYGIGAQNILEGLKRFDSSYEYKDRAYPPLTELNPDVVVVESFSYNPIGESSDKKNEYQETLRNLIEKAKATGSKVVFMATIGPYKPAFGDGPGGVNWPDAQSWLQASLIENYLQTGLGVAKSSEVLVSDVYHQSLDSEGNGRRELVSTHDGIHPSVIGHQFLAAYLAHTLAESSLF